METQSSTASSGYILLQRHKESSVVTLFQSIDSRCIVRKEDSKITTTLPAFLIVLPERSWLMLSVIARLFILPCSTKHKLNRKYSQDKLCNQMSRAGPSFANSMCSNRWCQRVALSVQVSNYIVITVCATDLAGSVKKIADVFNHKITCGN